MVRLMPENKDKFQSRITAQVEVRNAVVERACAELIFG